MEYVVFRRLMSRTTKLFVLSASKWKEGQVHQASVIQLENAVQ